MIIEKYISKLSIGDALANTIVFLYLLPLLVLGQDAYVGINDNLDAHIIWYRILTANGLIFADSFIPISEIMSAPRLSLYNEFYLLFWIHYLFDTFPAIVINKFIIHFTALWGMYLFLKELKLSRTSVTFGALFFALLPFSQFWGISIAGQPLVLYVLFKIGDKGIKFRYLIPLIIYTLYSNFYSVSFFYLTAISVYYLINFIKSNCIDWSIIIIVLLMVILSLAMEYRLIESLFFNDSYISHRLERNRDYYSVGTLYLPKLALLGHYSARSFLLLLVPIFFYCYE